MTIILGFLLFILVVLCALLILLILMQKASSNAGMGSALGGGMAESVVGGGASDVLTKGTVYGSAIFFLLSFILFLGYMFTAKEDTVDRSLPEFAPAAAPTEAADEGEGDALPADLFEGTGLEAGDAGPEAPASETAAPAGGNDAEGTVNGAEGATDEAKTPEN